MDENLQENDIAPTLGRPYRVGLLPLPGFALMSYASTVEPLRAANLLSRRSLYEVVHFGDAQALRSSGAAYVDAAERVGATVDLDLILVVAGGDPFSLRVGHVSRWLRQLSRRGVRIGGVSGGPVVLAQAGLMAGRRMTVHWEHAAALADQFPDAAIERRLFVIDRDRVTCGGGTAPLDLMHALIAEQHGAAFAQLVSDWFLHTGVRAATAPQRQRDGEGLAGYSGPVAETLTAMENHIGDPLSLGQLALVAGVSPRQLNRLFAGALGRSVMAQYREVRLATAQRLVRSTAMPMAEIAQATGFAHAGHFSNAYAARFGQRPRRDRRTRIDLGK